MTIEDSTMRKLMRRVVPVLGIGAVFQAFSQLNVAFAGVEMTRDLGLTNTQFGFGSGIFFLSYLLLGVPANIMLLKVGAKRWIALAMFAWGLLCASLALTRGPTSFYVLRLLLGAAEAGFIPGILYIAGNWFPEQYRGRVLSLLLVCNPISATLGGQISGWLLEMNGVLGLAGWQWVFIVEGLPASVLALFVIWVLPARIEEAPWLTNDERDWLAAKLESEHGAQSEVTFSMAALVDPRVIVFALIFFGASCLPFGLIFFLPKIIQTFGVSGPVASMLASAPFATGGVLMLLWGRSSDRTGERLYHALAALGVALLGSALYLVTSNAVSGLIGLCLTLGGIFAFLPIFWTLPNRMLSGAIAAMGIAVINGMGGVAGIMAPTLMGWLKDITGHYESGLLCVVLTATAAGVLLYLYGRHHGLHKRVGENKKGSQAPATPTMREL
ncbi:MFS transporter [Paraburkholderia fynbosensis]|uniref:Tartrate transporter n=1 Tax=Paraburkholderia fynbosensis TaxID=1200993 RepID=A0A6J5GX74_9BURK|nr:MFS transporter [Paraburkholderia fynbosensis]CAB3807032.1 Putative tartrate transporter [Paraburkholderia fynbosensis]